MYFGPVKILVTGATGFIGSRLAMQRAEAGDTVHILYRSKQKIETLAHSNVKGFPGTLLDFNSLKEAMAGCSRVYHVAAVASQWERDPRIYQQTNVDGTDTVLRAAVECGVGRVVFTSTAGVFGPSLSGPVTERTERQLALYSDYDRTKELAEKKVLEYVASGLDAVIVNPTRVFGPSSNNMWSAFNGVIKMYLGGAYRFLPGDGRKIGNYVYIDDVTAGHQLAMEHGRPGERYLLGGTDLSYRELFDMLGGVSGRKQLMVPMPVPLMLLFGYLQLAKANLTGSSPRLTPDWIRRIGHDYVVSSDKATRELGYRSRPILESISETVQWIRETQKT